MLELFFLVSEHDFECIFKVLLLRGYLLEGYGGGPFVLWPRISDERSPPEKRDMVCRQWTNWFCVVTGRKECFPFFRWWFVRHEGSTKQGLVVRGLFLEHCFVTNEAPFRFPEVILVPIEPQKRDLHLWNCPRASAKQGGCLLNEFYFRNVFGKGWWIWDLVLSPVRRHQGFMSWEFDR